MQTEIIILTATIVSSVFSLFSLGLAVAALIKTIAAEKSTHSLQYVPIDPQVDQANKEYLEGWATSEDALEKQRKAFREELKEDMPELYPDEEDKKIYSF